MSSEWRSPQGEAQLTGSVVYRCASCGGDIDGEVRFFDPTGGVPMVPGVRYTLADLLTPTTRTYHPKHVPVTED